MLAMRPTEGKGESRIPTGHRFLGGVAVGEGFKSASAHSLRLSAAAWAGEWTGSDPGQGPTSICLHVTVTTIGTPAATVPP